MHREGEREGVPWRASSVIEERLRFVILASRQERGLAGLCREFGISRQTGYTWLGRYEAGGASAVADRSRRPRRSPRRTPAEIEEAVAGLRRRWPDWGAAKLRMMLIEEHAEWGGISVRTVHRILDRQGWIKENERHEAAQQRFERSRPNELWQMDFKGPQGFNRGSPVGPLSIQDDHSRYLLALKHLGSTQASGVQRVLEEVFEQAGLPEAMLIDHGTPWWNAASPWGVSELAVWIIKQGIGLVHSAIRHPQTQGKVERMHGALQRAVRKRKADPEDQEWLDAFRQEYNYVRPHEGLGMATPASRWHPSPRVFNPAPPDWDYPPGMQRKRLGGEGQLSWRGHRWEISMALRRQLVGIEEIGERAVVYFCRVPMRELNLCTGASYPIPVDLIGSLRD